MLNISNSHGLSEGRDEFETALDVLNAETKKFLRLITHVMSLSEFEKGLDLCAIGMLPEP
jgi:threonine dehydrogenase-like Zn-dependent dehydrogenase